jgi:hypothetical protein
LGDSIFAGNALEHRFNFIKTVLYLLVLSHVVTAKPVPTFAQHALGLIVNARQAKKTRQMQVAVAIGEQIREEKDAPD